MKQMSRLIDVALDRLSTILYRMGDLARETVSLSFDCYIKGEDSHERVLENSQNLVFLSGVVEDQAVEIIARYQPVATDLRTIKSHMKIAYDFSRYGRYAWDITSLHHRLKIDMRECMVPGMPLEEMSKRVLEMVGRSIEAVRRQDVKLAETLHKMEDEVDGMYFKCLDRLVEESTISTRCIVSNLLFVRHLERIADHAAYIGESIIYIVTGERIPLR